MDNLSNFRFITAADIGKFLSDLVIRGYGKLLTFYAWCAKVIEAVKSYVIQEDQDSDYGSRLVINYRFIKCPTV